jgi:ribose/xylose/arabinose/galactoside ABC-type transport system permease subunit
MSTIPRCRRSFGQSSLAPGWPDFESPGPFEPKRWSAGGDEPVTGDYTLNSPGFLQRNLPHSRRGKANALTILAAIAITIILSITIPHFLRLGNILNILEQLSILGFMSIGMTFVMVSGGIDLSTYTIVSAASVVGATAMVSGYSPLLGCVLMLVVGLAFGSINGVAIAFGRMIPFIVTLSTMVVAQGFAIWFTQAQSISGLPDSYVDAVSGKIFDVIPIPAVIIIVVAVISGVILGRTQYGRSLYLTGTNEAAAAISGIPVRLTKFVAYVFSGLMAGITAIVLTAMVGTATTAMVRDERLMDVIATTVIGGASLKGGSGSVLGTMVGLLFITVLSNSFNLLGVSPFIAIVIKGAVLVMVIGLDTLRSR